MLSRLHVTYTLAHLAIVAAAPTAPTAPTVKCKCWDCQTTLLGGSICQKPQFFDATQAPNSGAVLKDIEIGNTESVNNVKKFCHGNFKLCKSNAVQKIVVSVNDRSAGGWMYM